MSWPKFLRNIGNVESARESIRLPYKKHFEGAAKTIPAIDRHAIALYGALATRYRLMGKPVGEVQIWSELVPFLGMAEATGVEAPLNISFGRSAGASESRGVI